MKFKLKETSVAVRGESVRVRELTHAERLRWVQVATEDRFRGPALLISICALDPKMKEEEVGELPGDVVQLLANEIMKLSGLATGEKVEKEAGARGAVSMSGESGAGDSAK
jgi:hypothetical protein